MRSLEKLLEDLDGIVKETEAAFPEAGARLEQLSDHAATVAMVITHIHEEAARSQAEAAS